MNRRLPPRSRFQRDFRVPEKESACCAALSNPPALVRSIGFPVLLKNRRLFRDISYFRDGHRLGFPLVLPYSWSTRPALWPIHSTIGLQPFEFRFNRAPTTTLWWLESNTRRSYNSYTVLAVSLGGERDDAHRPRGSPGIRVTSILAGCYDTMCLDVLSSRQEYGSEIVQLDSLWKSSFDKRFGPRSNLSQRFRRASLDALHCHRGSSRSCPSRPTTHAEVATSATSWRSCEGRPLSRLDWRQSIPLSSEHLHCRCSTSRVL